MQKQTETRVRIWPSWDYEKEEQWLDNLSAQGLHLAKAYPFWTTFSKDQSTRYVHRLDHQPGLGKKDQFRDYINLYADVGWAYKGSCMGMWHYFRRPWQAGAAPELYTDRTSLKQHYQRIQRLMGGALLANVPITLLNVSNLRLAATHGMATFPRSVVVLEALLVVLLGYGCVRMSRKIKALAHGD
jgi:hypothetical protein